MLSSAQVPNIAAAPPDFLAVNTMQYEPEDFWPLDSKVYDSSMSYYGGPPDGVSSESAQDTKIFGTKDGGCGYGILDRNVYPWKHVAAFDPNTPIPLAMPAGSRFLCGSCWRLTCNSTHTGVCPYGPKSIVVQITDNCPGWYVEDRICVVREDCIFVVVYM